MKAGERTPICGKCCTPMILQQRIDDCSLVDLMCLKCNKVRYTYDGKDIQDGSNKKGGRKKDSGKVRSFTYLDQAGIQHTHEK